MTQLETLIQTLCPNGVKFVKLGEVGEFENIGVDKKSNANEQKVTLLNYVDIYKNKYIDASIPSMVVTAPDKKITQCNVLQYDIFVTPTSETRDDIGHAAVVLEDLPNVVYSYHIMRFRLDEPNIDTAKFIRYLFETPIIQKQIYKAAKGLTRFGLSKYQFAELQIPLPPLAVQSEIVRVLDKFTLHKAELAAELAARLRQYEYYRDKLLTFDDTVKRVKLGEVCNVKGRIGFRGYTRNDIVKKGEGAISLSPGNISGHTLLYNDCTYISWMKYDESPEIKVREGDVILCKTGSTLGKVAIVEQLPEKATINPQLVVLKDIKCNNRFLKYILTTSKFQNYIRGRMGVGSVPNISQAVLNELLIPLPPLSEQERIVSILDRFDALCHDIREGLPAEIELRQKQYEHYRDKLLTFEAKG